MTIPQLKTIIQFHTQNLENSELITYYEKSKIRRIKLVTYDSACYEHVLLHYSSKDGKNFENIMESGKSHYYNSRIDFSD